MGLAKVKVGPIKESRSHFRCPIPARSMLQLLNLGGVPRKELNVSSIGSFALKRPKRSVFSSSICSLLFLFGGSGRLCSIT